LPNLLRHCVARLAVDPGDRPQRAILLAAVGLEVLIARVQLDRALEVLADLGRVGRVVHGVQADLVERQRLLAGHRIRQLEPERLGLLGDVVQLEVGLDRLVVVERRLVARRGLSRNSFSGRPVNSLNSAIAVLGRSASL
jgi:hypothetical protein